MHRDSGDHLTREARARKLRAMARRDGLSEGIVSTSIAEMVNHVDAICAPFGARRADVHHVDDTVALERMGWALAREDA